MSQYIRRAAWPAALMLVLAIAACSGDKQGDASALAQDSALARDLARVGGDTAVVPALQDVPVEAPPPAPVVTPPATKAPAPRPKAPAPKPAPPKQTPAPAPAPATENVTPTGNTVEKGPGTTVKMGTVAAGATMRLGAADKVCTNTNKIGDRFVATLNEAVTGSDGAVIPSGAAVTIELTQLKRSENANDQIEMGFRVINIAFDGRTYALDADVQTAQISRVRNSSTGNDAKKVLGGAVAGAVIGQILGKKSKGTIIGAAAGAAAGGAAAAATANYEGCVDAGAPIVVRLNAPVTVAVR